MTRGVTSHDAVNDVWWAAPYAVSRRAPEASPDRQSPPSTLLLLQLYDGHLRWRCPFCRGVRDTWEGWCVVVANCRDVHESGRENASGDAFLAGCPCRLSYLHHKW